ncbi:flagellar hook-associated protein FlgK [Dissulfurirhabdus thermomarina]|uniref:Flagellar hook-associated protein 1 n=1 Tax=Dissulfurirhabdus thermomarina TaxID=1765737 RepID=A0A6N9TMJ0_DISTH|nr:flagellar hook-associated protein FlgK [Dissulfurirhabdus thermomarina]NDY42268.1 flagellar hook-associated protein FlgK [Dissulfurirhabdus thermomarina]NMX22773.1 flagellar hook-associated protein FlgK [Dissulfurirhabdus thermomarina]
MSGLNKLLDIGKTSLLAQQTNLQVTGHNVSNVNTEGYSRQSVTLAAREPTPMEIGPIGNGVEAVEITRAFDRFVTTTLFDKVSVNSGLETRTSGMKLIEGILNEVPDTGLDAAINDFWAAWDDLANNAEGAAERTSLLQRAQLLVDGIHDRYNALFQLSQDLNLNIQTAVEDVNRLADQIADLNVRIVALESEQHPANDLRDQRDQLIRRLSEQVDIHWFENQRGSYTVLIGAGKPLVEDDKSWHIEYADERINWVATNGQRTRLTTQDLQGGELGGWLDIKTRIQPRDTSVLVGSRVNTSGGKGIQAGTDFALIDGVTVTGPFTIQFSGTDQNGNPVTGTFDSTVDYDGDGTPGRVGDFLFQIEAAYPAGTLQASINDEGRLTLTDLAPGTFPITFRIDAIAGGVSGLDFGRLDGSYPLNYTEQLNRWAAELIKAVNGLHGQGVGLVPLQESTGVATALDPAQPLDFQASGLPFADQVQTGRFAIWLYDAAGNVVDTNPATPLVNDPFYVNVTAAGAPGDTSMNDVRDQINAAGLGLTARVVNGRLVVQVDGTTSVAGFAFGEDTSGALLAMGMNAFFTGEDAATIGVNPDLVEDPRLVAAARVEPGGLEEAVSTDAVRDGDRPLGVAVQNGVLSIDLYNASGVLDHTLTVPVTAATDDLDAVMDAINADPGLHAEVRDGLFHLEAVEAGWSVDANDGATRLFDYLGITPPGGPGQQSLSGAYQVERTFEPLASHALGVAPGTFDLYTRDAAGTVSGPFTVTLTDDGFGGAAESLRAVAAQIDAFADLAADVVDGRLVVRAAGNAEVFLVDNDTTGLTGAIGLATPGGGELAPADNRNALAIRDLSRVPVAALDGATLNEGYQSLVGEVGIHSRGFQLDYDFSRSAVDELQARRDEISAVSLDEEMADLIKFQHSYAAAAKLMSVADELFVTLLQTKQ